MNIEDLPPNLSTGEVAKLFGVDPKTVVRWANVGHLPCFRTLAVDPGHPGHRRFPRDVVVAKLTGRDSREEAASRAEAAARAAWSALRELLDAGHEVTLRAGDGGYEAESGKTVAGTVYRYGDSPEAAVIAAWEATR